MKKITQSFLKDMKSYIAGEGCGHIMRAKWIDDKEIELDSKAAKLGCYFEYQFSGALPKDKKIPMAEMMVSGKDKLAPYRLADINVIRLKKYFDLMGLNILKSGIELTKGKLSGTIDLLVECTKKIIFRDGFKWKKGDQLVIDLKYSGLIDDRWNKHGWQWSSDQRAYHGIQARHYHFITGLPFYFLVLSSSNEFDARLFKMEISEDTIEAHIAEANDLEEKLNYYNDIVGWEPRPDIAKCAECPLKENCPDRALFPQVETIEI